MIPQTTVELTQSSKDGKTQRKSKKDKPKIFEISTTDYADLRGSKWVLWTFLSVFIRVIRG
jgi:hypothetical protein